MIPLRDQGSNPTFPILLINRESDAKIMTPEEIRARGWEYWQKIYTSRSEDVLDGMRRGYPDMGLRPNYLTN